MLSAAHRLTDPASFRETTRRGRRASSRALVVHVAAGRGLEAPRVGFVVSKAVGDAVTRNRVRRRLRHLVRARVGAFPDGCAVVVRALPAAAAARSDELARDLDRCLDRCFDRPAHEPAAVVTA